ncbi:zinc finger protein 493 [Tribolium castaneum]|uniref:Zinc finger protein 619-like Protein n=1 Tax=Tribolium castaneum TaxID=7070 RepID=D2A3L3_TRICA|nr:PREDICTED: zinc finger protein 493 [Tribolium castaneum]EFA04910.1 Zinc finger protein 619-like Protein [Tribolium castaneum]|eukprot:XP_008191958.1 PREDICTED: zinc finger protein 493 [Tribolium castaneum]
MEKITNGVISPPPAPDLNGNTSKGLKNCNGVSKLKDQIMTEDGRVFYPCQFCNKVFPIKKSRTLHIQKCAAKEYILSVGDEGKIPKDNPEKSPELKKIDIKQNIVLNELKTSPKSPPIKLTIKRSPSNGSNHFTVSNSLVLKEKNDTDDFNTIAKRLESNSVTITKQAPKNEQKAPPESDDLNEFTCRECKKEFKSSLELLRHGRKVHSYPKVLMALSEVKKFYAAKNRSECPICHKPLKTNFRSAFVKHLLTHTNEMKYSCKVCNKKFRRSDHMKAHEKRHV